MRGIFSELQPSEHPASRAFSYGTYALYREKALHKSCQVLVEHAQRVAKIHFRTQAGSRIALHVKCKQSAEWFCILPFVRKLQITLKNN